MSGAVNDVPKMVSECLRATQVTVFEWLDLVKKEKYGTLSIDPHSTII